MATVLPANRHPLLWMLFVLPSSLHAQAYNYPNGSTVADFTVTDIEGDVHDLYDLTAQGKYVLLDFFTLWCVPCQETAPYWAELYQTYGCNGADMVCLSLDYENNTAAEVQAYSDTYCGPWAHPPVVSDALALSDVFGVGTAPNYCLIGPDNVMINNFIWPVASMADFVAAFPVGSAVTPQACAVGVEERAQEALIASPNPTTGTIRINGPNVASVHACDAMGRYLTTRPIIANQLDLRGNAPGLYLLELFNARGAGMGRLRVVLE